MLLTSTRPKLRLKLGQILKGNDPFFSYEVNPIIYKITLPKAEEIMQAATGSVMEGYSLENVALRFECIREAEQANEVTETYEMGRKLYYDQHRLQETEIWPKGTKIKNITINAPIKMLEAIVILFTKVNPDDSEEFVSANVKSIDVTAEGEPNVLFLKGIEESDLYDEARRLFGHKKCMDDMDQEKFEKNAYAAVVDFRTVNEEKVIDSGRKLMGTQTGIQLQVKKDATTEDLKAYVLPSPTHMLPLWETTYTITVTNLVHTFFLL